MNFFAKAIIFFVAAMSMAAVAKSPPAKLSERCGVLNNFCNALGATVAKAHIELPMLNKICEKVKKMNTLLSSLPDDQDIRYDLFPEVRKFLQNDPFEDKEDAKYFGDEFLKVFKEYDDALGTMEGAIRRAAGKNNN